MATHDESTEIENQARSCTGNRSAVGGSTTSTFEVLISSELAERLKVKESWVIDHSKRSKTSDPIPIFRLGKHRRYRWNSPEMNAWIERRAGITTTRKAEPKNGGDV
jgi:hypothetical protein